MKTLTRIVVTLVGFAVLVGAAFAGNIGPGSPPPALEIKHWIKGDAFTKFENDKTYVVEFWATWCGPCKTSIPHLTEMAKKNSDVTFLGVSIWEDEKDGNIEKFVDEMGAKMDYNVAYSGNKEGMAESWMNAAGRNGIPCAFIIKGGTIQWIGHPMEMEKPLEEIKAGTFDMKAFKAKYDVEADKNRKAIALNTELRAITAMYDSGKTKEAHAKLDSIEKSNPEAKAFVTRTRYAWLAKEDPKDWEAQTKAMVSSKKPEDMQVVLSFANAQGAKGGNVEMGRKAFEIAMKATDGKDFLVLQYAQSFYGQIKEYKNQLDILNKLTEALPTSPLKDNAQFKEWLEKAKKDAEAKLNAGG